jgi:hypothetical protein
MVHFQLLQSLGAAWHAQSRQNQDISSITSISPIFNKDISEDELPSMLCTFTLGKVEITQGTASLGSRFGGSDLRTSSTNKASDYGKTATIY